MDWIVRFWWDFWGICLEASPYLVLGFGIATALHYFVPTEWMVRLLGKGRFRPTVTAALVGIPLPLCSCSVVPTALAIRRKGASKGSTLSFLVSTPETGVDSILLSFVLLNPVLAIARPLAAGVTAIMAGVTLEMLTGREPADAASSEKVHGGACCAAEGHGQDRREGCAPKAESQPRPGSVPFVREHLAGLKTSFLMLFDEVAHWIFFGLIASAAISASVPSEILESGFGEGWRGMAIAVVLGLPMYVCAVASTPLAAVLMAKGLSAGAALVFLLVGPATNLGTMTVVKKVLGARALASYLFWVVATALGFGVGIDSMWPEMEASLGSAPHVHGGWEPVPTAAAGLVLWLLAARILRKIRPFTGSRWGSQTATGKS